MALHKAIKQDKIILSNNITVVVLCYMYLSLTPLVVAFENDSLKGPTGEQINNHNYSLYLHIMVK